MERIQLTVLGSGVAWANPGGVCSGYLVQARRACILLECGTGTLGRLRAICDPAALDAVIISHLHADHLLDLIALRYGIKYGGLGGPHPLRVLLPPDGKQFLAGLGEALDRNPGFFSEVMALEEYAPAGRVEIGGLTIRLRRVQHYIPSHAMRFEAGNTLAYSADAAPCEALVDHARGADTLLCEAAIFSPNQDEQDSSKRGHLMPAEAGQIAQRAGVGRLLITHSPLDPADPDRAAREARSAFAGPVERVVDGKSYVI